MSNSCGFGKSKDGQFKTICLNGSQIVDSNKNAKFRNVTARGSLNVKGEVTLTGPVKNGKTNAMAPTPDNPVATFESIILNVGPSHDLKHPNEAIATLKGKVICPTTIKIEPGVYNEPLVVDGFSGTSGGYGQGDDAMTTGLTIIGDDTPISGKTYVNNVGTEGGAFVPLAVPYAGLGSEDNGMVSITCSPNGGNTDVTVEIIGGDDPNFEVAGVEPGREVYVYDAGGAVRDNPDRWIKTSVMAVSSNTVTLSGIIPCTDCMGITFIPTVTIECPPNYIDIAGASYGSAVWRSCVIRGIHFKIINFATFGVTVGEHSVCILQGCVFDDTSYTCLVPLLVGGSVGCYDLTTRTILGIAAWHNSFLGGQTGNADAALYVISNGSVHDAKFTFVGVNGVSVLAHHTCRLMFWSLISTNAETTGGYLPTGNGALTTNRQGVPLISCYTCHFCNAKNAIYISDGTFNNHFNCTIRNGEIGVVGFRNANISMGSGLNIDNTRYGICLQDSSRFTNKFGCVMGNIGEVAIFTQHKSSACFNDNLVTGDPSNYEIEYFGNAAVRAENGSCVFFNSDITGSIIGSGTNFSRDAVSQIILSNVFVGVEESIFVPPACLEPPFTSSFDIGN